MVFEDTPSGIAAARAAGMRAIGLRTTYSADKLTEAVAVIGSLAEVRITVEGKLLWIDLEEKR
jgi:sugar-phosphatase